ncbi:T9SS type B sorting domain-containing protein [Winogradskyella helgolandensis]|uniref:T9SS type B sorting domain-containing protein n=1 Tax=Winogradskyella helgolandensis TaxID=2697010 RepID=UPI0015C9A6AE|nr:gliding motility-associated C-terminal domain-containing protein [Winogradskyella helgolandensis]
MIKFKSFIIYISFLLLTILVISCGDDDNNQGEEDVFSGCCSGLTAFGEDVDNLDQSQGDIIADNIFTPNGDGINDYFQIENIELYNNHEVTIYSIDDEVVFQSTDYGSGFNNFFPVQTQGYFGVDGLADGTYKYKIVVENEQIFKRSGFFCLFTNNPSIEQNFAECDPLQPGEFDQILTGL